MHLTPNAFTLLGLGAAAARELRRVSFAAAENRTSDASTAPGGDQRRQPSSVKCIRRQVHQKKPRYSRAAPGPAAAAITAPTARKQPNGNAYFIVPRPAAINETPTGCR